MLDDLFYIGKNGKAYYGAAALTKRIFTGEKCPNEFTEEERKEGLKQMTELAEKLGYVEYDD